MLWTIALILGILWLLGVVTGHTLNGFIYILLILAIASAIFQVLLGRKSI